MTYRKPRKHYILKTITLITIILVSLTLIFNKQIRNMMIQYESNSYKITHVTSKEIEKNKDKKASFDFDQVKSVSTEEVLKSQWESQQLPVIGGIAIPEIGINLPIFKGVDNVSLLYGAGTMKKDQEMGEGNYSLASHHLFGVTGATDLLFSPLAKSKLGMKIYLTDKDMVYTYTIKSVEIVNPKSVYVINDVPGKTEVTLVTCTDAEATQRTIVKGEFEGKTPYNGMTKDMVKAFEESYNQYKNSSKIVFFS